MRPVVVLTALLCCALGGLLGCGGDEEVTSDAEDGDSTVLLPEADGRVSGDNNDNPDANPGDVQPNNELDAINQTLQRWREAYQSEDVEKYMGVFWDNGFLYTADLGTLADRTDDVVFDEVRAERESAVRVFQRFLDIEIEVSEPPELTFNKDMSQAEVRHHYRIQGFLPEGQSLPGGFTGWFAEGVNVFTFAPEDGEWRIQTWTDMAWDEARIRRENGLEDNPNDPQGKFVTTWGMIKTAF